jgi:hypothetical protein
MRNSSTDDYKFILLKIINPLKTEVLSGKDAVDTTGLEENITEIPANDHSLYIGLDKKTFSPREEVRLNIRENTGKGLFSRLCISVIPESTYEDRFLSYRNTLRTANNGFLLPETRGISLSGQLIGKGSGKPVAETKVNLSIIGDKDILVVRTDSTGRFFFALPDYYGNKDIFLCADELPDMPSEILIDNDFCSRMLYLPSSLFKLNEEEMKAAYKLVVNSRISSMYMKDSSVSNTPGEGNINSFYGEPSQVLVMDKYVELPTLEEYFTELTGKVKLRKVRGTKQFRVYINQDEILTEDPLLLVDWVAVDDIKKILSMSPREIERIELVNSSYVKGNITYGGIISFVSKKNDFAGIDLPTSGTFVNYIFREDCAEKIAPGPLPRNVPDSRNTVYWNPAVQINDDSTASISFTAPDTPGRYHIRLMGMTKTGELALKEELIVIMKD